MTREKPLLEFIISVVWRRKRDVRFPVCDTKQNKTKALTPTIPHRMTFFGDAAISPPLVSSTAATAALLFALLDMIIEDDEIPAVTDEIN